jgi:hypothetical protein
MTVASLPLLRVAKASYLTRRGILSIGAAADRWGLGQIFRSDRRRFQPPPGSRPLVSPVAALLGCAVLAVTIYLIYPLLNPSGAF